MLHPPLGWTPPRVTVSSTAHQNPCLALETLWSVHDLMRHRSVKSLAHHEVGHRLHAWLGRIEDVDRLASLNARLEEAAPSIQDLVSDYLPAEMQHKAAFTHDAEIGRLTYTAWPPAAMDGPPATAAPPIAAVTKPVELRALLARSPRSLLWRLANQGLFARLAEELFVMVLADWPEGDLSLSNVKDAGGEGGQIELWLPPAAPVCLSHRSVYILLFVLHTSYKLCIYYIM